jgi:hypothetical protein
MMPHLRVARVNLSVSVPAPATTPLEKPAIGRELNSNTERR